MSYFNIYVYKTYRCRVASHQHEWISIFNNYFFYLFFNSIVKIFKVIKGSKNNMGSYNLH